VEFRLLKGQVVDNNDPDKLGRLKIRVYPELVDVKESLLPWVERFKGVSTDGRQVFDPLSVGTLLWVLVSEDWTLFYWVGEYNQNGKISFSDVESTLSSITDLGSFSYEFCRVQTYEDGTIILHNLDSGTLGIIHSSGSYVILSSDGGVLIKSGNSEFSIDETGKYKISTGSVDLKSTLEDMQSVIANIITPANLVGNLGAPVIYNQVAADLPKIQGVATKLNSLFQ